MFFFLFQAVAYMLIQEALKSQMADKVRKQEEQEQLESMPLMELLRLVTGPSQREEVDRVRFLLIFRPKYSYRLIVFG